LPLAAQFTSHLRDNQIPTPSDLWYLPLIRLSQNNLYRTELRFFSAMARRLQSRLKQSNIYAVSLANSGDKKSGCKYDWHLSGRAGPAFCVLGTLASRGEGLSDGVVELWVIRIRNSECRRRNETQRDQQLTIGNGQQTMNDLKFAFRQLLKNPAQRCARQAARPIHHPPAASSVTIPNSRYFLFIVFGLFSFQTSRSLSLSLSPRATGM